MQSWWISDVFKKNFFFFILLTPPQLLNGSVYLMHVYFVLKCYIKNAPKKTVALLYAILSIIK